mmetsp:Transcript_35398/g.39153  ORF Transcript_35398/g.39153 Transcript_35398/m.39153 type:complete len:428 (-) Transcript_35398:5-1288(-)
MTNDDNKNENDRKYDIVIYGATGDAGMAIVSYMSKHYNNTNIKWAIAGRSEEKLKCLINNIDIIVASADDDASLQNMAKSTKLVLSTVGPYGVLGEPTLKACMECDTHYVDITGELDWVSAMERKYKNTTSILCSFAGYDCIPFELSTYMATKALNCETLTNVECVVSLEGMSAPAPRGTIRTVISKLSQAHLFGYSLIEFGGKDMKDKLRTLLSLLVWLLPWYSTNAGSVFTMPHFMGWCNIPVVRRSFNISGLVQDRMVLPGGRKWYTGYGLLYVVIIYQFLLFFFLPLYAVLAISCILYPSFNDKILQLFDSCVYRARTFFTDDQLLNNAKTNVTTFVTSSDKKKAIVKFVCQGDPGIVCTALVAAETALAIVLDLKHPNKITGFTTPAKVCGDTLIQRLNTASNGCSITVEVVEEEDDNKKIK